MCGAKISTMKAEHQATLRRVLGRPTPTNLPWEDIEAMLRAAGVEVKERPGDRIALVRDGRAMVLHRPDPRPITIRATVRDLAAFLKATGVTP